MISNILIHEPEGNPLGIVIGLAGRGVSVGNMFDLIANTGLDRSVLVSIQPKNFEWYPAPNNVFDQKQAVAGLNSNIRHLMQRIKSLQSMYNMDRNHVGLIGYSAGGVMALKAAETSDLSFAGVVAMSGVVLDPARLRMAQNNTPLLLQHSKDDEVFGWEDRYVASRDALIGNGYNVSVEEKTEGGHGAQWSFIHSCGRFFKPKLGY